MYFKIFPFSFSLWKHNGIDFFPFDIHCENLVELQEVELTKVRGVGAVSDDQAPLGVLSLRLVHTKPPVIHQLQLQVSYPGMGFRGGFSCWIFAHVSFDSLYLRFALWPHFFHWSKERLLIFSLCSFLIVNRMKWWLPGFLHARLETRGHAGFSHSHENSTI